MRKKGKVKYLEKLGKIQNMEITDIQDEEQVNKRKIGEKNEAG